MPNQTRTIRIFISSPGDVEKERELARQVIQDLQRDLAGRADLEPVLWERMPLPATESFQKTIDVKVLDPPIDIAVFILWSRLGSEVGPEVTRLDGTLYLSGTEREFDLMVRVFEESGRRKPHIMVYQRHDERWRSRLSSSSNETVLEMVKQDELVKKFIREQFHDRDNHNVRAYHPYKDPVSFAEYLTTHLRHHLNELLMVDARSPLWNGPPYRGLQVFHREHAAIFFGREEEAFAVLRRLRDQLAEVGAASQPDSAADPSAQPCAFVLIVGGSGSGKSSLARAGVAARLERRSYDEHVWRTATFLPGLYHDDLCGGLVSVLLEAVPELASSAASPRDLVRGLRSDPALAVQLGLNPMLADASKQFRDVGQVAADADQDRLRVLLVLDQLEELWTDRTISDQARQQFLDAIEAVTQSGRVAAIATLRSDFYPQSQAALRRLKGEHGHFDLLPPGPAALQRIITEPARLAGLQFEWCEDSQQSLDRLLIDDAHRDPTALPLLQYTLDELYRHSPSGTLTFAAYETLGGIAGTLGKRATAQFENLPADVQAALDELLPLLVTVQTAGAEAVVRCWTPLAELRATPQRRALTDALIAARFLTTDRRSGTADETLEQDAGTDPDREEIPVAALAHEALLTHWPQVRQWVDDNRSRLRLRSRVEQSQQRWELDGRDDSRLLPRGLPLEEGRQLIEHWAALASPATLDYVRASLEHDQAQTNRQRAATLVDALRLADIERVPGILDELTGYARWADPLLAEQLLRTAAGSTERRNLALARLAGDPAWLDELYDELLRADPREFPVLCQALASQGDQLKNRLWSVLAGSDEAADQRRLHAAAALAKYDPDHPDWPAAAVEVARQLAAVSPVLVGPWQVALRPAAKYLVAALSDVFRDQQRPEIQRSVACSLLADYAADQPAKLVDLICDADPQQFAELFPVLGRHGAEAVRLLATCSARVSDPAETVDQRSARVSDPAETVDQRSARVSDPAETVDRRSPGDGETYGQPSGSVGRPATTGQPSGSVGRPATTGQPSGSVGRPATTPGPATTPDPTTALQVARRRAAAAIALVRHSEQPADREQAFAALRVTDDPESLTQFVHGCRSRGVTAGQMRACLELADQRRQNLAGQQRMLEDRVLYGLLLALGEFPLTDLPAQQRDPMIGQLAQWYRDDPSSAIHGASGWLLRHWQQCELADDIQRRVVPYDPQREWFTLDLQISPDQSFYLTFVVFQPEEYEIGSPDDEPERSKDERRHPIRLTRPFAILDRPITRAEVEAFGFGINVDEWVPSPQAAMIGTHWYDAVRFCRWLTERLGMGEQDQAYGAPDTLDPRRYPPDPVPEADGAPKDWPLRIEQPGMRLPTEAEWEVACRAGSATPYSFGRDTLLLRHYAWFLDNSARQTHVPGERRPNLRGLFDMHGNVWEWCHDWYGDYLEESDPVGPQRGSARVDRGGGWFSGAGGCRSAIRGRITPSARGYDLGFRLAFSSVDGSGPVVSQAVSQEDDSAAIHGG